MRERARVDAHPGRRRDARRDARAGGRRGRRRVRPRRHAARDRRGHPDGRAAGADRPLRAARVGRLRADRGRGPPRPRLGPRARRRSTAQRLARGPRAALRGPPAARRRRPVLPRRAAAPRRRARRRLLDPRRRSPAAARSPPTAASWSSPAAPPCSSPTLPAPASCAAISTSCVPGPPIRRRRALVRPDSSLPGFMIPAGSQRSLSARRTPTPSSPHLGRHPRRVVAPDGVVVGERAAGGQDRVARRRLQRPPLRRRVVAPRGRAR